MKMVDEYQKEWGVNLNEALKMSKLLVNVTILPEKRERKSGHFIAIPIEYKTVRWGPVSFNCVFIVRAAHATKT